MRVGAVNWVRDLFHDPISDGASSKRLVGIVGSFVLFGALIYSLIRGAAVADPALQNDVLILVGWCLGLTTAEKFAKPSPSAPLDTEAKP